MLKKVLFGIKIVILGMCFIMFLQDKNNDGSYSYDDYNKEVDLVKKRLSLDKNPSLVKTYDLVNKDRIRLYVSEKNALIFVHAEREDADFSISTVQSYSLVRNEIHEYHYKKYDEYVYVYFGYNSKYNKIKFKILDKYGQKSDYEKNMFKNDYNIITFISNYEGEYILE